ncbi:hypothetical protein [Streptomyces sp. NBC_00648]|uniref:hypothetical protein n=1 Tax=Streptomyces sp. NBC_00648 TaxID=2975797 RepID=UPI003246EA76
MALDGIAATVLGCTAESGQVLGRFSLVLIRDFRGVRSWFEDEGNPDAYTRTTAKPARTSISTSIS